MNIGNPGEFLIRELAELVIEKTGAQSELIFEPLPQDDSMQRRPDISYATDTLDWAPTIPLADGLDRTIAYFAALHQSGTTP